MEKKKTNSNKQKESPKKSLKDKNRIIKKEKGFTLVELLAVIAVLAIVIGIASASFIGVKNKTLEGDYENLVSLLETKAANYAKKTGITTISVEDLILAGEISPDDETDIYNPINKKSLNCYILKSEYKEGEYVSTLVEKDNRDQNNKCTEYEKTQDYVICEYNNVTGKCVEIDNNKWKRDNITLALQKRNGELVLNSEGNDYIWSWTSTSGQTGNEEMFTTAENLASKNTYRVQVTMEDKIAEATAEVAIDKEAPMVSNVKMEDKWEKEKNIEIEVSDFNGSGVKGVSIGTSNICPNQEDAYNITPQNNIVKTKRTKNETIYVCAMDNVGNITNEAKEVVITKVDSQAVEDGDITLVASTADWVKELIITGTAIDKESGLVEYAFTKENSNPTWQKLEEAPTNQLITKTMNVTERGTYYFWVKDLVGNEKKVSITINNIDNNIDSINLTKNTNDWVTSLTITGTATDTKSGIVAYQFTNNNQTPQNWMNVSPTASLSKDQTVTQTGTYYFWVKDKAGNIDKRSIVVDNIGTLRTITFKTPELSTSGTYNGSQNINKIKKVLEATYNNGYSTQTLSRTSFSGNTFRYTVSGGKQLTGKRNGTCTESPDSRYSSTCASYSSCNRGGKLSGGMCVSSKATPFTADGYWHSCNCSGGTWHCDSYSGDLCGTGYHRVDLSWSDCSYNPTNKKGGDSCSTSESLQRKCKMKCDWNEDYEPSCSSYETKCNSGEIKSGSYCYYCSRGSIQSIYTCQYSCLVDYHYYQYEITVKYVEGR